MLTLTGFIARDLYDKGVLPSKYANLVGHDEEEMEGVTLMTSDGYILADKDGNILKALYQAPAAAPAAQEEPEESDESDPE